MKKLIFLVAVLLFAFWILAVSVVRTVAIEGQSSSQNYKLTMVNPAAVGEEASSTAMVQKGETDYFLAYPGILPDNFLYSLKMIRDRIWLWLTVEPLKKAELMLLFADKRLGAGKVLIEGNKIDLGVSTLSKAEKYLQRALAQERTIQKTDEETKAFLEKLSKAASKHEEILLSLIEKTEGSAKSALEESLNLVRQSQAQIKQALNE
jgi:hypothetical protein